MQNVKQLTICMVFNYSEFSPSVGLVDSVSTPNSRPYYKKVFNYSEFSPSVGTQPNGLGCSDGLSTVFNYSEFSPSVGLPIISVIFGFILPVSARFQLFRI
jgi:hypothetical protein